MSGSSALPQGIRAVAARASRLFGRPIALLSRDDAGWHFEAEGVPESHAGETPPSLLPPAALASWSGVLLGHAQGREWMLMLPGNSGEWQEAAGFEDWVSEVGAGLREAAQQDENAFARALHRRLYGFALRLASRLEPQDLHRLVLRTMSAQATARIAALAVWQEDERALAIAATIGYPRVIVEHLRIAPGQGVFGTAFAKRDPVLVRRAPEGGGPRRPRYRSDSYMVVPIMVGWRCVGVVGLTDRADARPFDERDLGAARLLAAQAALAFERQRVMADMGEWTRLATVDAVTGLFNRHYLETRLEAELQRALRHDQPLALLMLDIDDFKRINDTTGHIEGDRALRQVADLLRSNVRVFDVCARYGGEEFVIVMPGATEQIAGQVADRIRRRVEAYTTSAATRLTLSVGISLLRPQFTTEQLIMSADRALIAAKAAGKNAVWIDDDQPRQVT